jgi:type IV pilus assembly protein PilB
MAVTDVQLRTYTLENEFVTQKQIDEAELYAKEHKVSLYDAFIEKNILSDAQLGQIIADYLKCGFINLAKEAITKDVLHIIPEHIARKYHIISFFQDQKTVKVATQEVKNTELFLLLKKKTGKTILPFYATERDLEETLPLYNQKMQAQFDVLLGEKRKDTPIEEIVQGIIENAYDAKASDIHIEPRRNESIVRIRIDGILHDILTIPKELHEQIVTKIKVDARLRTDEHMSAQDGKIQKEIKNEHVDIRVSLVPIIYGEGCVMRLLTSKHREFGLSDLGLSDENMKRLKTGFTRPYGMILSTGPTGSGKSTSMYSILKILNTKERNIATIEDPVEYDIEGMNQIQVNPQTNLTFAAGLRSILRQDPDIIYVGEIRDNETADIAIHSAMTGHLVLSTLHTNDAATSIPRLIDMGVEPFLVSSTISVIVAQRLVRKVCESCKVSTTMTPTEIAHHIPKEAVKSAFGNVKSVRLYMGKGCPVCHNTGYSGRIGIFEVLMISPRIQELIHDKTDADTITKQAVKEGMQTMLLDGLQKVTQGITTIEEVLRVIKN